ncbi:hypothetical protein SAMN05720469_11340 [Fibrobacter intestinalis]|uniref:Uncharacterized protein n=2 Tax=Fibrobacter TaxID=832 RepID=A0A1M6UBM3_9BACT|nr:MULTISPECIES: hypothetical protein [Fibrobacter]PBC69469.1 hypothetical protein BGX14_1891 [Fibrobacter sp. UWS1]SHK66645.1 hypothetical protein SAMN05720469_11340 [Fibrobacter intestinalis]
MLATMIFACFARLYSLKPTVKTLETIGGSLPNLGIEGIPSRSNLGKSPRARKRNGHALPYKLFHAGRIYDRAAVQGSLGSGELLQVVETELEIESFMGTTRNAVEIQVYVSIISMLLLRELKDVSDSNRRESKLIPLGFSCFVTALRPNLFRSIPLDI